MLLCCRFDQDFNPQNDKQAHGHAHCIGQERDVDVMTLIARDTVEEEIMEIAKAKLALDYAVTGSHIKMDTAQTSE